jgi:hypothetical protein
MSAQHDSLGGSISIAGDCISQSGRLELKESFDQNISPSVLTGEAWSDCVDCNPSVVPCLREDAPESATGLLPLEDRAPALGS